MFAARKEKGTMIFFETSWVVIIIIMVITIKDWRKRKELEKPIDEKRLKELDEEVEKFHKWWNENMAAKYGGYFDENGDDGKDA